MLNLSALTLYTVFILFTFLVLHWFSRRDRTFFEFVLTLVIFVAVAMLVFPKTREYCSAPNTITRIYDSNDRAYSDNKNKVEKKEFFVSEEEAMASSDLMIFSSPPYLLTVPDRTFEDAIKQAEIVWREDGVDEEMFPRRKEDVGTKVARVIYCATTLTKKEVAREMSARGLRPASAQELLAFVSSYPKAEHVNDLVALGQKYNDAKFVWAPRIRMNGSGRCLDLVELDWLARTYDVQYLGVSVNAR